MKFLRNTWYVAAWDTEIQEAALFQRILLNEPVLLFRDEAGKVQAISDRCPHRFAPLHMGKHLGNAVQCPYHGLEFNGQGRCTRNPHGDGVIPKAAAVKTYPAVEKYSLVWVWMGDPGKADENFIPDFSSLEPEDFYIGKRYLHVQANYVLESDNIMDLSHIQYVHPGTLGSSDVSQGKTRVEQRGDSVWSFREIQNEIMPDFLYKAMNIPQGTRVDRWIDVRWDAPANMMLFAGAVPTGRPREEGVNNPLPHLFTPETEKTSHYWFAFSLPKAIGEMAVQIVEQQVASIEVPFRTEDLPMLKAQQKMMGDAEFWDLKPVLLAGDAGAVRARRVLDRLIAEEQA